MSLLAGAAACPSVAWANEVIDLEWEDLIPKHQFTLQKVLRGLIPHEQASLASQQPPSTGVRDDWDGQTVRLPGFVVPLDFRSFELTSFILVPYVGACVHVPPPPANQLVFVTTETPYELVGLFAPIRVTGNFRTADMSTELAEIGYTMSADKIEAYDL